MKNKIRNYIDWLSLLLIWAYFVSKELWWWAECKLDDDVWFSSQRPTLAESFDEADNRFEEYLKTGKK